MKTPSAAWFFLFLLSWAGPAAATDGYSYRKGEHVTISDGLSPDGRWSIAAHGGGPYGSEGFDVYLLREPAHARPVPLHIQNELDTGPLSIVALWSPDSSRVAILYRSDRHVLDLRLFALADGKVQPVVIPSLVDALGRSRLKTGARRELFSRLYRFTWQAPDRFTLEEFDGFQDSTPEARTFTDVFATAVCEFTEKGRLRLSGVKRLQHWPESIIYSPHLRYNEERGLYSTQTSVSSLDASKDRK